MSTRSSGPLLLPAGDPAAWISGPLARHTGRHDAAHGVGPDGPDDRWWSWPEVREGALGRSHRALVADGVAPASAAKRIATWFGGSLADVAGFTFAVAGAGLVLDLADVRWRLDIDGVPERLRVGRPGVVVPSDHPWAGLPGVRQVPGEADVAEVVVASLELAATPVLVAARELARVGRSALWTELADSVGLAVAHDRDVPVTPLVVDRLDLVLAVAAAPWRRRPTIWATGDDPALLVGRKAGCCLSYQDAAAEGETCGTCSLRTRADCEQEQRAWHAAG